MHTFSPVLSALLAATLVGSALLTACNGDTVPVGSDERADSGDDGSTSSSGSSGASSGSSSASPVDTVQHCTDAEVVLAAYTTMRGSCVETETNQRPSRFERQTCEQKFEIECGADLSYVDRYLECLSAIEECEVDQPERYDLAVKSCMDTFEDAPLYDENCPELFF